MTASIPASQFANVIPGVLSAGGNPLSLNAVFLTADPSIPPGTVQAFPSAAAVSAWFGPAAPETVLANVYFAGYINCTTLPSVLYFAQFNAAAVAGYVRGGSVAALTLAQVQALSGTIAVAVNGETVASAAINLSSATTLTNAATLMQTGLQTTGNVFTGTATCTNGSPIATIVSTTSGQLHIGDTLVMTGVPANSTILSFGTYTTGTGTGTVTLSANATITETTEAATVTLLPTVTYDALRQGFVITSPTTGAASTVGYPTAGTLTTGLNLTAATGAVVSAGAAAATPASVMNGVVAAQQNWATFMTVAEQALAVKEGFATWVQGQNQRYLYVCQDSDPTPTASSNASGSFGNIEKAANATGIMPVWDNSGTGVIAALQCAIAAATNFAQTNGRTTFGFRGQAGLSAQVTSQTVYQNLVANGYNCYAAVATANQQFTQNQPGQITGAFAWADTYVDQIYLNASFQLALMNLLANTPAVPYVSRGYALIRAALLGPIKAGLNFGSIVKGVTLSTAQQAQLQSATGDPNAVSTINATGYYLQILDPGAIVRGNRGTPVINFWYTDGGSVQQITMSSVDVL